MTRDRLSALQGEWSALKGEWSAWIMAPSSAITRTEDRPRELARRKLLECVSRLRDPRDGLTWSGIKKAYGRYGINARKVRASMRDSPKTGAIRGRPWALSPERERRIVDCIVTCQRMGFSKTRRDVERELIIPMASTLDKYPFKIAANGEPQGPTRKWWKGFLHRHRDRLHFIRACPLSRARAAAATPLAFESVYRLLRGRMDVPENLVFMDETELPVDSGWERRVLGESMQSPARVPAGIVDQRHMSLVAACTAAGCMLPPVYICAGSMYMKVGARAPLCGAPPRLDRGQRVPS